MNNAHAITYFLDLFEKVRAEENGKASLLELKDEVSNLARADWINAGGGFVEDKKAWVLHEGLSQPDPLKHALRIAPQTSRVGVLEAHQFQKFPATIAQRLSPHATEFPVEPNRLLPGQVLVEVGVFWQESDLLTGVHFGRIPAEDRAAPFGRGNQTEKGFHGRGFARPIRSDQSVYLAGGNLEGNVVDGSNAAFPEGNLEVLHEALYLHRRRLAHLIEA